MIFAEKLSPTLTFFTLLFSISPLMTACSTGSKNMSLNATSKKQYLISHPPKDTLKKVNALMPVALKWYSNVGKTLYGKGRILTKAEKKQAKQLGVRNPNAVRVVILDRFPEPGNHIANNSHFEGARAMGNIIMMKPHLKDNSMVLCHELVHVAQKDRLGLKGFLKQIALEKEILGYSGSLLESEAYALQRTIQ